MATTNTSDRTHSRFLLRLRDIDENRSFDFHLYQGRVATDDLNIVDSAIVHNDHKYSVFLLASKELVSRNGLFDINDEAEEEIRLNPIRGVLNAADENEWHCYQVVFSKGKQTVFSMVFGLARIRLTIEEEDDPVSLETLDIACACDKDDYKAIVSGMLDDLIDTQDRQCIDWMFSPVRLDQEDISMVKSAMVDNSTKNLKSLVDLCRTTVRIFKRHLDYFMLHGHCRTTKREMLVSPDSVRRLGRNELLWLARNPEQLYESKRRTAVNRNGKHYMAFRIQTERTHKSFDNIENRALVSFAGEMSRVLAKAISDVEACVDRLQKIRDDLEGLDVEGNMLPTLVVIDTCLKREIPIIKEAKSIQRETRGIHERLLKAFPDVLEVRYILPKRTKIFQEILPYADIHAEMRKWNTFGRTDVLRDTLALHTWRIDKLYEYHTLYKMLEQFRNLGFSPDDETDPAIRQVRYSAENTDAVFRNERQVANVYSLVRNDERITLYYQPVFYGDEREEHGIDLHRATAGWKHPYWTPDYLIVHKYNHRISRIVIDAKFRSETYVHWNNAMFKGSESRSDLTNSAFLDCILKYKVATCGSNGNQVDAMWILFGRTDEKVLHIYQRSKWAKEGFGGVPDGIASSSPKADCIAEMMDKIGISKQVLCKSEQQKNAQPLPHEKETSETNANPGTASPRRRARNEDDARQFDLALELVRELASIVYNDELLFDPKYSQRNLGLPHSILKRKPASGHEAKLYSSQLVEIGKLSGYIYTRWHPNNLNRLRQLVRKSK